jgi:hypothetical protein
MVRRLGREERRRWHKNAPNLNAGRGPLTKKGANSRSHCALLFALAARSRLRSIAANSPMLYGVSHRSKEGGCLLALLNSTLYEEEPVCKRMWEESFPHMLLIPVVEGQLLPLCDWCAEGQGITDIFSTFLCTIPILKTQ